MKNQIIKILNEKMRIERLLNFIEENKSELVVLNDTQTKSVDITRSIAMREISSAVYNEFEDLNIEQIKEIVREIFSVIESSSVIFSDQNFNEAVAMIDREYRFSDYEFNSFVKKSK